MASDYAVFVTLCSMLDYIQQVLFLMVSILDYSSSIYPVYPSCELPRRNRPIVRSQRLSNYIRPLYRWDELEVVVDTSELQASSLHHRSQFQ